LKLKITTVEGRIFRWELEKATPPIWQEQPRRLRFDGGWFELYCCQGRFLGLSARLGELEDWIIARPVGRRYTLVYRNFAGEARGRWSVRTGYSGPHYKTAK